MNSTTDKKMIRKFGLVAFVFFGFLCSIGIWRNKPIAISIFGLLSLLGLCFIFFPLFMKPVYTVWMKISNLIGKVLNLSMLTLVYYIVITPTAYILKLLRVNPLRPKANQDSSTYWVTRQESAQPKERFYNRY